ncbi:SdpA family antimicrobial peptide system protein [Riemerella anatipestifer]|uniref:SdpA family antimicrobial peptide system protein n=1 Tax=Riemerella anatipestifer TaxID=34085 RepID=UPI00129DCA87|nr:SdpA family antimicrobial peptide system protein [Riemerella anatipestifer]MRM96251.1 SdpA family antimicrobial peptide system protein [Riemerella anatipestifer]MRN00460.1 SdpA family antimicrobial peptide system protein [Riemerella anatipestifer]MRN02531.1 SdpA family antimicrobial peptide system protein [Riemerella anatipestifer]
MLHRIKNIIRNFQYTISALFLSLFIFSTFSIILISSIPFNPIQYKINFVKQVYTYLPQGWAFFTRDARENQLYIYKINNNKLEIINQKHSNFENIMGLSRRVSKLVLEAEVVSNIIGKNNFYKTNWNFDSNLHGIIPNNKIVLKNPIKSPILCGDYVFVYHKIVPWAWSKNTRKIRMEGTIIKVRIKCQN